MPRSALWIRSGDLVDQDLERALTARGFPLVQVPDPAALTEEMAQEVGVLLLEMGFMDQLPALRARLQQAGKHVPLVVMSADDDLATHLRALRQGADAFFAQPMDTATLVSRLEVLFTRAGAGPSSFKVLVVEDDPRQAQLVVGVLQAAGIETFVARESLKILDALRTFRPDLILMDIYMPEASGVELTAVIRNHQEFIAIPIVYLSAEPDLDKQMAALSVGGEDFLTNPIVPKQLLATVRNRVVRARQLQEGTARLVQTSSDPAWARRRTLALLEQAQASRHNQKGATGLIYLEIDSPILLLELLSLAGLDELMAGIKEIVVDLVRSGDQVARFGDFCLLVIAQRQREEQLVGLASTIKEVIDHHRFLIQDEPVNLTVSLGLRLLDGQEPSDPPRLVDDAIKACHQARGTDRVRIHRASSAGRPPGAPGDEEILARISDTDNLQLVFQPIVSLQGLKEPLYQCLLRLRTPEGVLLPAAEFLPSLERTEQIYRLDRWVIMKIMILLRKTRRKGPEGLRLIVSQAVSSLHDKKRTPWMQECLTKLGIGGEGLVLEYRLPDIGKDLRRAARYQHAVRNLGVGVSLSIAEDLEAVLPVLERFPAQFARVTESQIRANPTGWERLVERVHKLGMRVIVSRIETTGLLGELWGQGVDFIQGDFIQQPASELGYDFSGSVLG